MSNNFEHYFIGVDVGTSSVRSVVIDSKGHLCGSAIVQLLINSYNPSQGYFEQSSDQIWEAVCTSVSIPYDTEKRSFGMIYMPNVE